MGIRSRVFRNGMNRIKAVQQALEGRTESVYLEIGVSRGEAFQQITANTKIAVDPAFAISPETRRLSDAKAKNTFYFEATSDDFFAREAGVLDQVGQIDVALIDGMHTYHQVMRDVDNTLKFIRDDGVIVLHDCNPANSATACPAASYADFRARNHWWNTTWSGDVWKAVVHLRTRGDLQIAVLDCDFGVGLVKRGRTTTPLNFTPDQIAELTYSDLKANREGLLNLVSPDSLDEFIALR